METIVSIQNRKNIEKLDKYNISTYLLADKAFSSSPKGMNRNAIMLTIEAIHKVNKKAAVKVDRLYQQNELEALLEYLIFLNEAKCDYVIFSDIAVKQLSDEHGFLFDTIYAPETLITNRYEVNELRSDGFNGLVISKDIPLNNALVIADQVPDYLYLRVHGPILMSYSERRFISLYLKTKKEYLDHYFLSEEKRDLKMPIVEKKTGTWFYYACLHCLDSIKRIYSSNLKGVILDCSLYDDKYTSAVMQMYCDVLNGKNASLDKMRQIKPEIEYIEVSDIRLTQLEKD